MYLLETLLYYMKGLPVGLDRRTFHNLDFIIKDLSNYNLKFVNAYFNSAAQKISAIKILLQQANT